MNRIRPIKIIIGEDTQTSELCLFDFSGRRFIANPRIHGVLKVVKLMVESLQKNEGLETASIAHVFGPDRDPSTPLVTLPPLDIDRLLNTKG